MNSILSEQEKQFFKYLPSTLCVMEVNDNQFRLIALSEGLCNYLDIDYREMPVLIRNFNNHRDRFISVKDQEMIVMKCRQRKNEDRIQLRFPFHHPNGKDVWLLVNGYFRSVNSHQLCYCQVIDLTKEKIRLDVANAQNDHLATLLNDILSTTQTCIFWKDDKRRFVGANKAFLDYYGFPSLKSILNKTDEDMGWHNEPDYFMQDEMRVLNGERTYRVHGKCIAKGKERDIVASKAPLYNNGKIVGLVGSFEDVTLEYRQREEIEGLNKALVAALKNEEKANAAKAEFMARMSHDMRTPLTTVIGLSEKGLEDTQNEEDYKRYTYIKKASEYLLSLLNDILNVEKLKSGRMTMNNEVVDINEIYGQVEGMTKPSATEREHEYTIIRPKGTMLVKTDRHWVMQILINLINNAIKYTPRKGKISWVITQEEKEGKIISHHVIKDNGVGISNSFIKEMYEPFSQEQNELSHSETSTGLGLSIVKKAIDMFEGDIECHSILHEGTTFTLTIPYETVTKAEEVQFFHQQEDYIDYDVLKGKHILICEDVDINAQIIAMILQKYGMTSEIASDGNVGIEKCRHNQYDAILMDIRMPNCDGLTAAKRIREFNNDVSIIALSANTYLEDIQKSIDAGMNAHIGKPIDKKELLKALVKFIR
ncbi:PAS domain S-box-containing protein [Kandleria vitulina]|uniref:histidine kinase n=1 Tax=Kandleria vitulina TaxID=1630 RepID=A0A1H2S4R5_9FIRM|nr:PAS domain-containing sensor histidine kinase [Kandleria vitulina]SDW26154.1 PAS domain S-box-containing protein [Kandleria vitulina]